MPAAPKPADHFSGHAGNYAKYRPGYPDALFAWLAQLAPAADTAWDCGCGNGQATTALAAHFLKVLGTDLSAEQVTRAPAHPRVEYRAAPADRSGLPDGSCDLVTVAQALHWFDFDDFYAEAGRVLKPGGILAAWTYTLLRTDPEITALVERFDAQVVGPWWPPERRWVDQGYRDIPFPYRDIQVPRFEIRLRWTRDELLAYVGTWSASERYRKEKGEDPTNALRGPLAALWPDPAVPKTIVWPIAVRAGRKPRSER